MWVAAWQGHGPGRGLAGCGGRVRLGPQGGWWGRAVPPASGRSAVRSMCGPLYGTAMGCRGALARMHTAAMLPPLRPAMFCPRA